MAFLQAEDELEKLEDKMDKINQRIKKVRNLLLFLFECILNNFKDGNILLKASLFGGQCRTGTVTGTVTGRVACPFSTALGPCTSAGRGAGARAPRDRCAWTLGGDVTSKKKKKKKKRKKSQKHFSSLFFSLSRLTQVDFETVLSQEASAETPTQEPLREGTKAQHAARHALRHEAQKKEEEESEAESVLFRFLIHL